MSGVEFGILGPLSVRVDGRERALPAGKHRVVLAALLLRCGQVVSIGELIEYLWADSPPPGARRTAQTYVLRLRRAFAPHVPVVSHRDGYLLHVEQGALDLHRFRATVAEADEAAGRGDLAGEIALLRSGLSLWRGLVLADVPSEPLHAVAAVPLAEERLQVLERVVDQELTAGRHRELVAELRTLTAEHPLRERFWADLMLALYRSGRQAEALEAFRTVDARLREELGIEPGEALQRLHQAVLVGRIEPERAAVAVPSVAPWVARCTLPLDVGAYVGRTEQTLELVRTLTAGGSAGSVPVVAVCGPPGVGKTALAVRVAHRVRAEFPDGQWYLRLGGRDPAELLAELLHATGLSRAEVPEATDAMAAQLRARLADRRVLLLLDDAADAAQVRPLLPGTPGCAVLVTSRVDLGGLAALNGATIHVLEVLRPEDADSLFAALLHTTAGDEARLAEIARLCGYLPLALRVAAANLVQRGGRTEEYLAELRAGDRLGRLAVVGDPQTAVRATFDVSYLALPEPVRRLFRLLGLVPGREFDQGAAAALLGGDDREAAAQLAHLAMCHLVESPSAGRFQFHDLMRLYAAERAAADEDPAERNAAVQRLHEHYLDIADGAGAVPYPDLSRLPRNRRLGANGRLRESGGPIPPETVTPRTAPSAGQEAEGEVWVMTLSPEGKGWFAPMNRNDALPTGATALLTLGATKSGATAATRQEPTYDAFVAMFELHRRLGRMMSPAAVLPSAITQTHVLRELAAAAEPSAQGRLLLLAARYAEFAGWMAQEAGSDRAATWWTQTAVDMAEAAGDQELAAHGLVRTALVAMLREDATQTVALAGRALADTRVSPRVRGLAALREAQGHALAGDDRLCHQALDRAVALLDRAQLEEPDSRLALGPVRVTEIGPVVTGWCLYDLGRPDRAAQILDQWVPRVPSGRARARFGARRALAHAAAGELDRACHLVGLLLDEVELVDSATIRVDLRRLSRTLTRWRNHPSVQELQPRLAAALHVPVR